MDTLIWSLRHVMNTQLQLMQIYLNQVRRWGLFNEKNIIFLPWDKFRNKPQVVPGLSLVGLDFWVEKLQNHLNLPFTNNSSYLFSNP